nr:putative ribonuclease h protein [Quercus suber]
MPFISSPVVPGWEGATVASLLNFSNQEWRLDSLNQLFSQRDVELIRSIPLCSKPVDDALIWPYTPTGSYTVKSGYRFLYNARCLDSGEYNPVDNKLWKKVWSLQVQPKVRNFLWRAIKNSIPTKHNLRRRMVLANDDCDHCHCESEDVLHALWSCPSISQVWSQNNLWANSVSSPGFSSFKDLVETIVETGEDLNIFATTVWAIWNRRNSMRTSGKHIPVQQVFSEVQMARTSWVRSIPPRPPEQPPRTVPRSSWMPPPESKAKVNFDGAVFREMQRAGVGVIVRNAEGCVLASMAETFHLPFSVAAVEVIAAKKALQFARDIGLSSIILEGDSKITIDGLKSTYASLNEYGHLLVEAKEVAKQMEAVEFLHVPRQANKSAHNIAKHARHVSELTVWMEDVPPHLVSVIQADSAINQ